LSIIDPTGLQLHFLCGGRMRFHLAHLAPNPAFHGLYGHTEVIETIHWGLRELGHEVTSGVNQLHSSRTNIIFGAQMLQERHVNALRPDTIVYNLEQCFGLPPQQIKPPLLAAVQRFRLWEYSDRNFEWWHKIPGLKYPPIRVGIGWAPILRRIPQVEEDIDVLFYGLPGKLRMDTISELCIRGMRVLFVCGLYGPDRDALIARSKLVLNLNRYVASRIFEVVRVSYLLANGKAVVSDVSPETYIEDDLREALAFAPPEKIPDVCAELLADDARRKALAAGGRAAIEKRDIRLDLRHALAAMGIA
jgi:hypothetical protein